MSNNSIVTLSDGSTYDISGANVVYATCDTSSGVPSKVATLINNDSFSLSVGSVVAIRFVYTNGATNTTINVNNTGPKQIWYNDSVYSDMYGGIAGYAYRTNYYVYDGTYWVYANTQFSDVNFYDSGNSSLSTVTAESNITAKNIIVGTSNGYHNLNAGTKFSIKYQIFYAVSAITTGSTGSNNYISSTFEIAPTQSITLIPDKAVYIKGTIDNDEFTPIGVSPLTQTVPTNSDDYFYILLGYANTSTTIRLYSSHPRYAFRNGSFAQVANDASTVGGIIVPANAKFTDTTYESKQAVSGGTELSLVTTGEKFIWNNSGGGGSGDGTGIYYGTCSTSGELSAKEVTITNSTSFILKVGAVVCVKFEVTNTYDNQYSSPITLNVNNTGAKYIYYETGWSAVGNTGTNPLCYGYAGRIIYYMYDGTYWVWLGTGTELDTNYGIAYSTSPDYFSTKYADCESYLLKAGTYLIFTLVYSNTSASALKLNIQRTGDKPIYINGNPSSATNYSLPAGQHLIYYDGYNYYFRTDGKITGSITGNAETLAGLSVVPQSTITSETKIATTDYVKEYVDAAIARAMNN